MKRDNKGFSLVELIITLAVMGILSTSVIVGMGIPESWRATKCSELLESTLSKAKVQAMSKGNVAGVLFYQLDGVYYGAYVATIDKTKEPGSTFDLTGATSVIETIELGHTPLELNFTLKSTTGAVVTLTLTDNTSLSSLTNVAAFAYNRDTGAIKPVVIGGVSMNYTAAEIHNSRRTISYSIAYATGKLLQN